MPRSQGFARGDLDTSFPLDEKFVRLQRTLSPERYYAAIGVYFCVAAATWREAERKAGLNVCPDAPEAVADLQAVGLLDADGCVTKRAWAHSVLRARTARRAAAVRKAEYRDRMSRGTPTDGRGKDGDPVGTAPYTGTVVNGGVQGGANGAIPPLTTAIDYLEERSGRPWHFRPGSQTWDTLEADVRDFGAESVITAMRLVRAAHPDHGQLVFGASRSLHAIESPAQAPPPTTEEIAAVAAQKRAARRKVSDA